MENCEFIDRVIGLAIVGMFIGLVVGFGVFTGSYLMLVGFLVIAIAVASMIRFNEEETYETYEDED